MNKTSQLKKLFEDSEIESLRKALVGDKHIIPTLEKLINSKVLELMKPTGSSSFSNTWALEKAYREGGAYHLQQILNIFKEK